MSNNVVLEYKAAMILFVCLWECHQASFGHLSGTPHFSEQIIHCCFEHLTQFSTFTS